MFIDYFAFIEGNFENVFTQANFGDVATTATEKHYI